MSESAEAPAAEALPTVTATASTANAPPTSADGNAEFREEAPGAAVEVAPSAEPAPVATPAPPPAEPVAVVPFEEPQVTAKKRATWDDKRPGVLIADLGGGFAHRNMQGSSYGSSTSVGGFGWLGIQGTLVGLLLNDFFLTQRWRIEEYLRLGVGLGARTNKVWFGVEYGAGIQGTFRLNDVFDVGARFYRAFFNDTNMVGVDKGVEAGVFVLSGRVRVGDLYLDYTRGFPSERLNRAPLQLNIVEARYIWGEKEGAGLGLRVDFALGKNGQPKPYEEEFTNLTARLTYIYASY